MAFDVYPNPQTAPLSIAPGGAGTATALTTERHSGGSPDEMFIRVAIVASAVAPTLKLAAGAGDAVVVPLGTTAAIFDGPGSTGNYVAAAIMEAEANGVYLVTVVLSKLGSAWTLTIVNNDAASREFTFVVADSDADSQQPWIDVATTLAFDALITETGAQSLRVFNYGTGALSGLVATASGANAASFAVTVPPATTVNPNSTADISVALQPTATPQSLAATLDIASNDTTAVKVAGHNSETALSASVGSLELAFMLDASGSMAFDPDGNTTFIGVDNSSTRWGKLTSAIDASLTMLKNFASGKGTFAVGMYPNITAFPADPTAAYGGPFPVPSPSADDFETIKPISASAITEAIGNIGQHFPRVNGAATPMGAGIAHAIGSTGSAPWGYFSASGFAQNRRWLILMTDGNDNSDPPLPSDFFDTTPGGKGFVPKQIQVMALGYGNDAASGAIAPVNTTLLTQTAQAGFNGSAANYDFAQADATPDITTKFIKSLLFAGLTLDSIADPAGELTAANPTVSRQVTVGDYDDKVSFIVAWSSNDSSRLDVEVTTPLGEVLTAQLGSGCTIDYGNRYRMVTVDKGFLDNAKAGKPRYGTWTLAITLDTDVIGVRPGAYEASEFYSYQIVTDSRLNLRCTLDRKSYAAGDAITLSAALSLEGQGITGAAVKVARTTPASGTLNWLAAAPLDAAVYARVAASQSGNPDIDSLGIKRLALAQGGTTFTPVTNSGVLPLTDADATGTYTGTLAQTSVPGTYGFVVTAVGLLPDGSLFQREQSVTLEVLVQPDPAFTLFQIDYVGVLGDTTQALCTVRPRDKFGNVILIDPAIDPSLLFTISGGTFTGAIVDNHDGSYSRGVSYPTATPPTIGVTVGGVVAVPPAPLVPVGALHYIDKVFGFRAGAEGAPGANEHAAADACLGDFTKRATPTFVSLGAGGALVVGFVGHHAIEHAEPSITVFVQPDDQLRAYSVEAHRGEGEHGWTEIGRSAGVTQTFSLNQHHLSSATILRIRDLSGQTRNANGSVSSTPGVSIVAVGTRHLERREGFEDLFLAWLRKIGHELFGL